MAGTLKPVRQARFEPGIHALALNGMPVSANPECDQDKVERVSASMRADIALRSERFSFPPKNKASASIAAWTAALCLAANSVSADSRTISLGPLALGLAFDASGLPEPGTKQSDVSAGSDEWQALVREIIAGRTEAGGEILGLKELFFEVNADSAGPLNGLRLFIDGMAVSSGNSEESLSNFTATGVLVGARPGSRFSKGAGEPDAKTAIVSADRISVFDASSANGDPASESPAGIELEVVNLKTGRELPGDTCPGAVELPGATSSLDLSARFRFGQTGLQVDSDIMLRRTGKPGILLKATLELQAQDSEMAPVGPEAEAMEATPKDFRLLTQSNSGRRPGKFDSSALDGSTRANSACLESMLGSALSAADEILAAGTQISLRVKAKRTPTGHAAAPLSMPRNGLPPDGAANATRPSFSGGQRIAPYSAGGKTEAPAQDLASAQEGAETEEIRACPAEESRSDC